MPKNDPRAEVRSILADLKAQGITVEVTPGRAEGFADRPSGIIDAEARALGMSFGFGDEK